MATQVQLYPPITERSMGMLLLSILSIWFSFMMTCNITNYSLMSLNVYITHPITFYLLEQYSIPLKPVLGGVIIVALSISSHEQTESAVSYILGSLYF